MFEKKVEEEKVVFDISEKVEQEADKIISEAAKDAGEEKKNEEGKNDTQEINKTSDVVEEKETKKKEKKKKGKKKKKKKWIIFVILLLIVGGFAGMSALNKGKEVPIPVTLSEVTTGDIIQTVTASGSVESEEEKVYFSKVSAPISQLNVALGQGVKAGETLVSFDTEAIEDSIKQTELENQISKTSADASIVEINSAQSKVAEAAKNYDEAVLYVNHYQQCVDQYSQQLEVVNELTEQQSVAAAKIEKLELTLKTDPENKDVKKELKAQNKIVEDTTKKLEAMNVKELKKNYEMCAGDLEAYKALKSQYESQKEATNPSASLQKKQQSLMKESADLTKELATEKLEDAKQGVVAEFDGIVSAVSVVKGQSVMEGGDLFTICNAEKIKVTIPVSKYDIEKVKVGQKAAITINGNEYDGEVVNISRLASKNETGGVVVDTEVRVLNPDDAIVLGIEGKVRIETAKEIGVVLVPSNCINYASDGVFCFVVEDSRIKRVDIETGISDDDFTQIISGLKAGDKVVSEISTEIQEGTLVTEAPDLTQMMGDAAAQAE